MKIKVIVNSTQVSKVALEEVSSEARKVAVQVETRLCMRVQVGVSSLVR